MRRPSLPVIGSALLALLCLLQLVALLRAPAAWMPSLITVRLAPGESVLLGRDELAAPHAAIRHLSLGRGSDGSWSVRAAEGAPPVTLIRGKTEQRTGSMSIVAGQRFAIGPARFAVTSAAGGAATFTAAGSEWQYDGATLRRDGRPLPACPDTPAFARAVAAWNRFVPHAATLARPLSIGGNLYCGNRLGVPHVAPGAAAIVHKDGGLELAQAAGSAPLLAGTPVLRPLAQRPQGLGDVDAITVGRTRFALEQSGAALTLRPSRYVSLFPGPQATLPGQLEWRWHQRSLWSVPGGQTWKLTAALFLAGAAAALFAFQRGQWPFVRSVQQRERIAAAAALLVALAGLTLLLLQRAGTPPGAGVSLFVAGAALWCCLLLPGRMSLAWLAGILLLATGLSAQLELGLGAPDSSWLRHYQKSASLLSLGLGIGAFFYVRFRSSGARLHQSGLETLLALLALAALAALAMQVLFGDETGVFDLQPVEFAKLALTALTAHCLAVGLGWHANGGDTAQRWVRWLRMGAPVLLFALLLAVALVQVDDFSPLILLLVWGAVMAFAFSLVARRRWASAAVACAVLAACGAIALMRAGGAPPADWSFYGDRFLVWLEPLRHPHTGQQMLLGARAIAEGAWMGQDSLLGAASLGQGAGAALSIPAVQDDFAPSFFLNRHGLAGGLLLWILQAAFIAGTAATAVRAFAASRRTRDFRQAWFARFCCFALCGGAAFVFGHFLLSWGTNLAIFPVMGQPMSFLSSGGSHLLFFICPLLAFGAISAQSFEEIESCRSMSNMKS